MLVSDTYREWILDDLLADDEAGELVAGTAILIGADRPDLSVLAPTRR